VDRKPDGVADYKALSSSHDLAGFGHRTLAEEDLAAIKKISAGDVASLIFSTGDLSSPLGFGQK